MHKSTSHQRRAALDRAIDEVAMAAAAGTIDEGKECDSQEIERLLRTIKQAVSRYQDEIEIVDLFSGDEQS